MASREHDDQDESLSLPEGAASPEGQAAGESQEEEQKKLSLEVEIQSRSTCERHITVTIPREDIDRYFDKEFSELVESAHVPGFRPGHVPRKLVEAKFRKEIVDKVKNSLLMDSIAQVSDEKELAAISEPDFKIDAIELPDEGPMTYEFDLEVRPEFDLPNWKGLKLERPVKEFTDADVDRALKNFLSRRGHLVPLDGPASSDDYISTSLTFTFEGNQLSTSDEELIRVRPVLTFRDGRIENFDKLMEGVKAGETRVGEALISQDAPNVALRGQKVTATFQVKEVKRLELPDLTSDFLDALGGFESEAELRDAVRDSLQRQLEYQQRRSARDQITRQLTAGANWDLPPSLLERQSEREMVRAAMELRSSGFSDDEIRVYENELRQNSKASTARALKEHFILERIAEDEKIEDQPEDYDDEIALIAAQSGETSRRVRARLEKSGRMDVLRNQIIERKVIDRILEHAEFTEAPYQPEGLDADAAEAVDRSVGGEEPEAGPAESGEE